MSWWLLVAAGILFCCVCVNKFSDKAGMPALLFFMGLGMLFGSDGIFNIPFENYNAAKEVCTVALLFIMFYGGFGTKWKTAKPVAVKAVLLSSAGVFITAGLTALFCYFALRFEWPESIIVGAVVSSTDAASVFSILRMKKLNLRYGTASLLEIESGSNDPMAYMLTLIGMLLFINSGSSSIVGMLLKQVIFGVACGVLTALAAVWILNKLKIVTDGLDTIFITAVAIAAFALPELLGGNGFLSVYLCGIIIGNSPIKNKLLLVHFFDGITSLSQIVIFFLLGLLSFPHILPEVLPAALAIAAFLTLAARPAAVFALLKPFGCKTSQCLLVSWAGLRGAASIVFSIMVISGTTGLQSDLFHIVFTIALLSVAVQGSLLPVVARKLDMVSEDEDVRKTFNDYQEEDAIRLMRMYISKGHPFANRLLSEVTFPCDALAIMIKRHGESIIPRGNTVIEAGDSVILSVPDYHEEAEVNLQEMKINREHAWCGKSIEQLRLPQDMLIAMIRRGKESIIPRGLTVIEENDVVIYYRQDKMEKNQDEL